MTTTTTDSARRTQRAGGIGMPTGPTLIIAGVLAVVGNVLHPRFSGEHVDNYRQMARSHSLIAADLVLLATFVVLTAGLTAVVAELEDAHRLVRAARAFVVVGGTTAIVQTGVELHALRGQARIFAHAEPLDRVGSFWSANAVDHLNEALTGIWVLVLLGAVPLVIAIAQYDRRAAPLGVVLVGLAGGALSCVVGVWELLLQEIGGADVALAVSSGLVTIWVLATGIVLTRRA